MITMIRRGCFDLCALSFFFLTIVKNQESSMERIRPFSTVRICTSNTEEKALCRYLFKKTKRALEDKTATDLPSILVLCDHRKSVGDCYESYRDRLSDLISPYPTVSYAILRDRGFGKILQHVDRLDDVTGVAIVKKSSYYTSWADFDNAWSCQTHGDDKNNSWLAAVLDDVLRSIMGTMKQCQYSSSIASSLTFTILKTRDPIACLDSGVGDIAFTDVNAAKNAFDKGDFNSSEFEIMCKNGTRMPFENYEVCNLGPSLPKILDNYNKTKPSEVNALLRKVKITTADFERHIWNNDLLCFFMHHFSQKTNNQ